MYKEITSFATSTAVYVISVFIVLAWFTLSLGGCTTAAERERSDDTVCANARDYAICRQNLMSERRDSAIRSQ